MIKYFTAEYFLFSPSIMKLRQRISVQARTIKFECSTVYRGNNVNNVMLECCILILELVMLNGAPEAEVSPEVWAKKRLWRKKPLELRANWNFPENL